MKLLGKPSPKSASQIYKSRNFMKLLGRRCGTNTGNIYKSRNFMKLLGYAGGLRHTADLQE